MIHASSKGGKVEVVNVNQGYYERRFLFAKRIPANIKELKEIEDINSIEQYINNNTSEKNEKSDMITKIIELNK